MDIRRLSYYLSNWYRLRESTKAFLYQYFESLTLDDIDKLDFALMSSSRGYLPIKEFPQELIDTFLKKLDICSETVPTLYSTDLLGKRLSMESSITCDRLDENSAAMVATALLETNHPKTGEFIVSFSKKYSSVYKAYVDSIVSRLSIFDLDFCAEVSIDIGCRYLQLALVNLAELYNPINNKTKSVLHRLLPNTTHHEVMHDALKNLVQSFNRCKNSHIPSIDRIVISVLIAASRNINLRDMVKEFSDRVAIISILDL